jgi:hypothetical protein
VGLAQPSPYLPRFPTACVQHPTLLVSGITKDTLTGRLLYAYTPRWPTPHHLVSRPVTIRLKVQ